MTSSTLDQNEMTFRRELQFQDSDFFPPGAIAELLSEIMATDTDAPIYVVRAGDLPPDLTPNRRTLAYTGPALHASVAKHLGGPWPGNGIYRGPGPTIVLVDESCATRALMMAENGEQPTLGMAHMAITVGSAIHEAAHMLAEGFHVTTESPGVASSAEFIKAWCQLSDEGREALFADCLPWLTHNPRFLRAAIHLKVRAEQARDIEIPGDAIIAHTLYELSPLDEYEAALGTEPYRCCDSPIREVLATQPSARFCDVWRDDVTRYAVAHPEFDELCADDFNACDVTV